MFTPESIGAHGPVNGMAEDDNDGDYVAVVVIDRNGKKQRWLISHGAADVLEAELRESKRLKMQTPEQMEAAL